MALLLVYVRLLGYEAKYGGSYPDEVLANWAAWLRAGTASRPVYVYFNNDRRGHAVRNAHGLADMLDAHPDATGPRALTLHGARHIAAR